MRTLTLLGAIVLHALGFTNSQQGPPVELKEGETAPNFSLIGSDGKTHKLSDYKGRAVVLAWFPAAFTGG